jgi:hypothetical protein
MSWTTVITGGIVLGTFIYLVHLVKKAGQVDEFKKSVDNLAAQNKALEERAKKEWAREQDHEKRMDEINKNSGDPEFVSRMLSSYPPEIVDSVSARTRKGGGEGMSGN